MTVLCVRGRAGLKALSWLAAAFLLAVAAAPALAGEPIVVRLDRATLFNLPPGAATVVLGNPLIADVSLQPGGVAVVTGKGYGATNVIVMDRSGAVLTEKTVEVTGPDDPIVVVYRGDLRQTYSCTPECSPRITLGDDTDFFTKTITESATRNSQAIAAAAQSGSSSASEEPNAPAASRH
jgi:Pilus formation protein N terminal region